MGVSLEINGIEVISFPVWHNGMCFTLSQIWGVTSNFIISNLHVYIIFSITKHMINPLEIVDPSL